MIHEGAAAAIVGLGSDAAGDDAIGLEVIRELERRGVRDVPLVLAGDPSRLVAFLELSGKDVVVVDAVVGIEPGQVLAIAQDELGRSATPVSTHGMDVRSALELARVLGSKAGIQIVGVGAASVEGSGLSPRVSAAIGQAADMALALARSADLIEGG